MCNVMVVSTACLTKLLFHILSCVPSFLQFTGSSLTSGKEPLKRPDDEDAITKQNKKRPRPILLQHMSPLLKVDAILLSEETWREIHRFIFSCP